ncbi:hypothetical protein BC829DRAFT_209235 [Chytridium lagenaria]|nr:hypothetical protein BC829DRAFT_209235 [Chytridium lagenaria]
MDGYDSPLFFFFWKGGCGQLVPFFFISDLPGSSPISVIFTTVFSVWFSPIVCLFVLFFLCYWDFITCLTVDGRGVYGHSAFRFFFFPLVLDIVVLPFFFFFLLVFFAFLQID